MLQGVTKNGDVSPPMSNLIETSPVSHKPPCSQPPPPNLPLSVPILRPPNHLHPPLLPPAGASSSNPLQPPYLALQNPPPVFQINHIPSPPGGPTIFYNPISIAAGLERLKSQLPNLVSQSVTEKLLRHPRRKLVGQPPG
ncbi:MAG: hypothetical protein LQ338_002057 [Usnochroma carphineum]|nr:MAG: hypothetical protein LQ338_002057 [Usnochroma carphineum]